MPPRTTDVGRGFPTFRVRSSILYRYSRNLVQAPRREQDHIPVSCRQVQVHRRHGQDLLPFPRHHPLTGLGFINNSLYAQTAGIPGSPWPAKNLNVHKVRCGVDGSPFAPFFSYSRRKNRAPMFWAADRSQLYTFPLGKVQRL